MSDRSLDIETCSECGAEIRGEVCANCSAAKVTKITPEEAKARDRINKQKLFLAACVCLLLTAGGFELVKDGSYLGQVIFFASAVTCGVIIVILRFRYP